MLPASEEKNGVRAGRGRGFDGDRPWHLVALVLSLWQVAYFLLHQS